MSCIVARLSDCMRVRSVQSERTCTPIRTASNLGTTGIGQGYVRASSGKGDYKSPNRRRQISSRATVRMLGHFGRELVNINSEC